MVRMRTLGLRIRLRHISSLLGLPVELRTRAVIDVGIRIEPNHSRASSWSLGLICGRALSCLVRSGSRRTASSRSRRCRRVGRVPFLDTLMSLARSTLICRCRVRTVLALPRRTGRSLRDSKLRHKNPRNNRHQTNGYSHKRSDEEKGSKHRTHPTLVRNSCHSGLN